MPITDALILAAGLGTRLRPFTQQWPKAFIPFFGEPCIQWSVDALIEAGCTSAVVNIHHHAPIARAELAQLAWGELSSAVSDESDRLLGSGGGVRAALARGHLPQDRAFYLLNADILSDVDLRSLAQTHHTQRRKQGVWITLVVGSAPGLPGNYTEVITDPATGLVAALGPKAQGRPFYQGVAVIEPEALQFAPTGGEFDFVKEILLPAISRGKVAVHPGGRWFDVGSPELWWRGHLEWLELLEGGRFSERWATRVLATHERRSDRFWVKRGCRAALRRTSRCDPPIYFAGDTRGGVPILELGPRSVIYGSSTQTSLGAGIGFQSLWTEMSLPPGASPLAPVHAPV